MFFKRYLPFLSAWLPPLAYMAAIFLFSAQSTIPAPIVDLLIFVKDKTLHFIEYGILSGLYIRAARMQFQRACPLRIAVFCVLAAAVYGLTDEWHQLYTPGRTADLGDVVADVVGAAAVGAGYLWYHKRRYGYLHGCPVTRS